MFGLVRGVDGNKSVRPFVASTDMKMSPIPSSDCFATTPLSRSQLLMGSELSNDKEYAR